MTRKKRQRRALKPVRPMVAGVDIGAHEHWVCGPEQEDGQREVRVFGAMTPQLEEMAMWLRTHGVESVAMESTYVYWIPVYELLEAQGLLRLIGPAAVDLGAAQGPERGRAGYRLPRQRKG